MDAEPAEWDLTAMLAELRTFLPLPPDFDVASWEGMAPEEIEDELIAGAEEAYDRINRDVGHEVYRQAVQQDATLVAMAGSSDPGARLVYQRLTSSWGPALETHGGLDALGERPLRDLPDELQEPLEAAFVEGYRLYRDRQLILQAVDGLWVRHLTNLDALREGIGLRAYGQQNPLVAYRKEAHEMYQALLGEIQQTVARSVYLVPRAFYQRQRQRAPVLRAVRKRSQSLASRATSTEGEASARRPASSDDLPGRNDPCWCGSGKKYKHCHMREDQQARRGEGAVRAGRRR
jgi:preprotein translocase subunit SecA